MMGFMNEGISSFFNNRWLVFVAAMWIPSCAGIGYLFGSISPTIINYLNYNQKQVAWLGVANDWGDSVGFLAGSLSKIFRLWGALLVGAIQNFVGYGLVWLVVAGRLPVLPLWTMCIHIFVGTNGETYFNTTALVFCVQNFPKSRGPVVGVLKGFCWVGRCNLDSGICNDAFPGSCFSYIYGCGRADSGRHWSSVRGQANWWSQTNEVIGLVQLLCYLKHTSDLGCVSDATYAVNPCHVGVNILTVCVTCDLGT